MIDVGDYVRINGRALTWKVIAIESRIDPLGVVLKSGLTGRHRRESMSNLVRFEVSNV